MTERRRPWQVVLALLAAVIVVDQTAKWWAWRHLPKVFINPGGDFLTGATIWRWYADPLTGALLDLAGLGLLSVIAVALARRRCPVIVTACGSLMLGGWTSNLLDRLGTHYLTAPGSIRGAVDFISMGGRYWNLADFFIMGATPLFLVATVYCSNRALARPVADPSMSSARPFDQPAPSSAPGSGPGSWPAARCGATPVTWPASSVT